MEVKKLIDLHTHTVYSDGEHTIEEVINKAINNNVGVLAITDHDNINGLNTIPHDKYPQIKIIPGVEITVKVPHGRMHVLGYDIDYNSESLINYLKEVKSTNLENLKRIVAYLESIGIKFNEDDLYKIYNKESNIGRPDIANLMIRDGLVSSVDEAFEKYLVEAFNKTRKYNKGFTYVDALNAIKSANGIPILAHPNSLELNHDEFESFLKELINNGLEGLEVYHPNMNDEERAFYMDMVNKYNLLYSAGSDFHGEHVKPGIDIGYGKNNLYITDATILKRIKGIN